MAPAPPEASCRNHTSFGRVVAIIHGFRGEGRSWMDGSPISMVAGCRGRRTTGGISRADSSFEKTSPPPVSPVGFRDPRPRCCPSVTRVLCVRMRFVPRSGLSPRLTNVNVSVGSTTCSLLQTGADKKKSGRAAAARRPITPPLHLQMDLLIAPEKSSCPVEKQTCDCLRGGKGGAISKQQSNGDEAAGVLVPSLLQT